MFHVKHFNVQPNYKAGKWQQNKSKLFHVKQFQVGKGFNLSPSEKITCMDCFNENVYKIRGRCNKNKITMLIVGVIGTGERNYMLLTV